MNITKILPHEKTPLNIYEKTPLHTDDDIKSIIFYNYSSPTSNAMWGIYSIFRMNDLTLTPQPTVADTWLRTLNHIIDLTKK